MSGDFAKPRLQPRPDGRGRRDGHLLLDDHLGEAIEAAGADAPFEQGRGREQRDQGGIELGQPGPRLGDRVGGRRRIGPSGQPRSVLPFLITTASRAFTRAS